MPDTGPTTTRRTRPPPPTAADLTRQLRDAVADLPRFFTAPLLRRRHQTWGATPAEITASMPGNDLCRSSLTALTDRNGCCGGAGPAAGLGGWFRCPMGGPG
jgi:hypothetical protein